jgi:integrase
MSVHPTKYGTWEVKYRVDGKQRSKAFKSETLAQRFDAEVMQAKDEGRPAPEPRRKVPTLDEFAEDWLTGRVRLADSTLEKYGELLERHIFPELGKLPLTELRPRRLHDWQQHRLDAGAGPAVLGKAQGLLRQILKTAVMPHEYLEVNPVLELERPEYVKREHRWLAAADVELLRGWYLEREDLRSATLVSVLGFIGIRPQDALALEWKHLDGDRLTVIQKVSDGVIVPGSKTGEHWKRRVYVPGPVLDDLADWRAAGSGRGLIFPRSDGQPWQKHDWDNWRSKYTRPGGRRHGTGSRPLARCFKLAAEDVGLGATLKPYDLRHTAATLYAAAGWTAVEIGHQLGHSAEVSQRTYQHLLDAKPGERRSIEDYISEARAADAVREKFGASAGRAQASRSDSA